ncbi:Helix-turn-helix family protein (fragment) [Acinetobacter proteolyticus]|uniref:Helix-turn-helix family protein n=1 Tax=Acinetobacter proteolyticus TaxID=1776741 RepID=A0A653KB69_9GAMM
MTPLRSIRMRRKLSLAVVAEAAGTDAGNLSRIETGKQRTTPQLAESLSAYFGNEISELQILYPERFSEKNDSKNSLNEKA